MIEKQINFKISQSTYAQKMKKIIYNLEQYFQNLQNILKLLRLNQKQQTGIESFQNNEFVRCQQLKYELKLFEKQLQEYIEKSSKDSKIHQSDQIDKSEKEKNDILQNQKKQLQQILKSFGQQESKLSFILDLQKILNTFLPSVTDNFSSNSQRIIKKIQDSLKQIKSYEIQILKDVDLINYFQEFIKCLYQYYEQKNQEFQQSQNHLILAMKEIFIQQQQIDALSQSGDLEIITNNFLKIQLINHTQNSRSKLLQLKLQLVSFKETFQILLNSIQSNEKLQPLEEALNLQQFLLDKIQIYPQIDIGCNNNWEKINFQEIEEVPEDTKQIKNILSKQKGILKFLLFILNLEQQVINSEKQDLELIDKEFGELFVERFACFYSRRIWQLLESVPIDQSIKNMNVQRDESQLKKEKEIYENLLVKLKLIQVPQRLTQITEVINFVEIIDEVFQNSVNRNIQIFLIPLEERLKNFRIKREEFREYQQQLENQDDLNNKQNDKVNQIEKCFLSLQFLIKIVGFENARISELKKLLEQVSVNIEQFFDISEYFLKQPPNIQKGMLNAFNSIILNLRSNCESLLKIQIDIQQNEKENYHQYFERILANVSDFSEKTSNKQMEINKNVQENQTQLKADLYELLNKLKNDIQKKLAKIYYQSDEIFIEQEFIIQQLQIIFLQDKEDEQLDEDLKEDLGFFDNYIQKYKDFRTNNEWKIKQGLVFAMIQISSNCFTNSITQFCQNSLIQLWIQEKDQRVRNLLKNQDLIRIQMQILQRDWKNQHDRIESELQSMLKKINDLQDQVSHEANLNKRHQLLKELDETTQQLEEYIQNVSEMGQQLRLITDFVNQLRKDLQRVEEKINQMKEQLTNMANDIKFLRGKSVEQLIEIRKWKVLKIAAQKNVKSIYVPLKTIEKKGEKFEGLSCLMNLEQFNDENGEVNEFLLNGEQTVLLIHGTAGSGKSTTAKKIEEFIWKLHGQSKTNQILIPIYISLPSLKYPVYQAVEEALRQDEYGFDELQLKECKEMLEQRKFRFLLIMDSYDEMKLENIQKNLYITNKLYQNWSNPLVIFTTRKEIFTTNNYAEWFAPENKKCFKEIELQNFNKDQKLEYLNKYTSLSIKTLIFETYEWQIQIENVGQTDITRFEMTWELLETQVLKSQLANNLQPDLLLSKKQIKSIIQFLKNNEFIALKSIEATRSLEINLSRLWSAQKFQNIMKIVNLDKLIETPYMMEIVVQALPLILGKAIDLDNLKQNFIKNFSKKMAEALKSFYTIQMYEQQRKQLIGQYQEKENQITLNDIHNLEEIDYNLTALQIWEKMEGKQIFVKFQLNQEINVLKDQLKNIFLEKNIKIVNSNERTIDLISDSLKEQHLTSFDFYAEFIMQHYLKQIGKLKNLGKSINSDRFLHDLQKYSTQLAQKMSSKQLTQVQYKQQGLLFKEQDLEDEWLNKFFNDDDLDGAYKKDLRSCSLIQQKGSSFQFVHKSIQEVLIAQDLFSLFEWSKNINPQVFSQTKDILSKKEKTQDCLDFLSSKETKNYYEAKINLQNYNLLEKQKQLNSCLNNMSMVINFIKSVKNHDFYLFNYSTDIYVESRRFFIKKVQKDQKIIKCLKFLVDLTRFEDSFIQSGSNALNLLVEMRADLSQQSFKNIKIQNTSVEGANFVKCDFSHSEFKNVNINGVNLNGALLINCNWQNLRIDELHQFLGHSEAVSSVCFSPDGTTLASGSKDKSIRLWDVKTGTMKQQLDGHSDPVMSVCFSPDGTTLVSGSDDKSIRLWDVKTGTMKQQLDGHSDPVMSVCFSPDGTTLASGSADQSIRLWDVKAGTMKQQLDGHSDYVISVCFSPDGTTLASGSDDKSIRLWNVKTGTMKQQLDGHLAFAQFQPPPPDSDKTSQFQQINNNPSFLKLSHHYQLSTNFSTIAFLSSQFLFQANKTLILYGHFENHLGMDLRQLFKQKGCIMMDNQF